MKKKLPAILLSLTALALITMGMLGCGEKKPASGDLTTVTLNEVAHSIFYAPQYVAIEEGYFEEEELICSWLRGLELDS